MTFESLVEDLGFVEILNEDFWIYISQGPIKNCGFVNKYFLRPLGGNELGKTIFGSKSGSGFC